MRLLVSWLRDFVDVKASASQIADTIGLRGFEVAGVEPLGTDDGVIDFEVTANRPDCLSVVGLAREVATAFNLPMTLPAVMPVPTTGAGRVTVTIEDEDLCPRYAAAVAEVTPGASASPPWLAARLQAAGLRPISAIVDLTNYVLIETGHPTHAFDFATLAGSEIRVRLAKPGERITTLDGVDRPLGPEMLVVADRDRAQAVAGVMGGAGSEVSASTTTVVFESAYFKPASVRRTSKRLGLKTEASSRFERGADVEGAGLALARIAALLEQTGAGRLVAPAVDIYPRPVAPTRLHLRSARLAALLGATVPTGDVQRILRGLGLTVTDTADGWDVVAPTFRVDLRREVDLIEEVGRHYGFDRLATTFPVVTVPPPAPDPRVPRDRLVRRVLTSAGYSEAVTFGFIDAAAAETFRAADAASPVQIANPLSAKFDTLRPSLIPGLVDAVAHNRRHGHEDVHLFEVGTRFSSAGETRGIALASTGTALPLHWSGGARPVDFFDIKGVIERLCDALEVPVRFEAAREPYLVAGQTAAILATDGAVLGIAGRVTPSVVDGRGMPRQDGVFVAEVHLDRLESARPGRSDATHPLPRFPFVVRDLSIVVADTLPAANIRATIHAAGGHVPAPLVGLIFFDRYQGKGVPDGHVSVSVRLTFQAADRTLTDAEVQQSVDAVLGALVKAHGAVQR